MIKIKDYGTHKQVTVRNREGLITACLYILPDGTTHPDSWIRTEGWK